MYEVLMSIHSVIALLLAPKQVPAAAGCSYDSVYVDPLLFHCCYCLYLVHWLPTPRQLLGVSCRCKFIEFPHVGLFTVRATRGTAGEPGADSGSCQSLDGVVYHQGPPMTSGPEPRNLWVFHDRLIDDLANEKGWMVMFSKIIYGDLQLDAIRGCAQNDSTQHVGLFQIRLNLN